MSGEVPNSGQALGMILAGDADGGLEAYGASLEGESLPTAPVGVHLQLLKAAGLDTAAERLTEIALERGANLAVKAGGFGADPTGAALEYEALFARGMANSRMAYEYCRVLAELGRMDALGTMLDPALLLRRIQLDRSLGAEIQRLLLDREGEAEAQEAAQSVRNMRMLWHLEALADPAAERLMEVIARESRSYLGDWAASDHPLASLVPTAVDVCAWGLISRGDGYNVPHLHPKGWATGVFYPASPQGDGGELMIGRPENTAGSDSDWHTTKVRPEAALLVLIPSFYTHWTLPLHGPGLRTSVAFDVLLPNFQTESAEGPRLDR